MPLSEKEIAAYESRMRKIINGEGREYYFCGIDSKTLAVIALCQLSQLRILYGMEEAQERASEPTP